jgi:TM2 domain-containing membrane protein YozV
MFCQHCGAQINDNAVVCVKCGCAVNGANQKQNGVNSEWLVVTLLCFFLGGFGIHRFYTGKTGTAVAQLLTCGGCGIWALVDFVMILTGNFTDAKGNPIKIN